MSLLLDQQIERARAGLGPDKGSFIGLDGDLNDIGLLAYHSYLEDKIPNAAVKRRAASYRFLEGVVSMTRGNVFWGNVGSLELTPFISADHDVVKYIYILPSTHQMPTQNLRDQGLNAIRVIRYSNGDQPAIDNRFCLVTFHNEDDGIDFDTKIIIDGLDDQNINNGLIEALTNVPFSPAKFQEIILEHMEEIT